MNNVVFVEVREGQRYFCSVELGHRLVEEAVHAEQRLEVAAYQIFHDEEYVVGRLKSMFLNFLTFR